MIVGGTWHVQDMRLCHQALCLISIGRGPVSGINWFKTDSLVVVMRPKKLNELIQSSTFLMRKFSDL